MKASLRLAMLYAMTLLPCVTANATRQDSCRMKVAVVLSGGGAKGMAHIGVLRVLERAGIPIDIITGTSMGALIGGLYSIGYDAETLDSLVSVQDWNVLLSDKADMRSQSLAEREKQNTYILSRPLSIARKSHTASGGLIGLARLHQLRHSAHTVRLRGNEHRRQHGIRVPQRLPADSHEGEHGHTGGVHAGENDYLN